MDLKIKSQASCADNSTPLHLQSMKFATTLTAAFAFLFFSQWTFGANRLSSGKQLDNDNRQSNIKEEIELSPEQKKFKRDQMAEELYDQGVRLLNQGDHAAASLLLKKVLKISRICTQLLLVCDRQYRQSSLKGVILSQIYLRNVYFTPIQFYLPILPSQMPVKKLPRLVPKNDFLFVLLTKIQLE